jgi:hypothetical protein
MNVILFRCSVEPLFAAITFPKNTCKKKKKKKKKKNKTQIQNPNSRSNKKTRSAKRTLASVCGSTNTSSKSRNAPGCSRIISPFVFQISSPLPTKFKLFIRCFVQRCEVWLRTKPSSPNDRCTLAFHWYVCMLWCTHMYTMAYCSFVVIVRQIFGVSGLVAYSCRQSSLPAVAYCSDAVKPRTAEVAAAVANTTTPRPEDSTAVKAPDATTVSTHDTQEAPTTTDDSARSETKYVIVGSGPAAYAAYKAIREVKRANDRLLMCVNRGFSLLFFFSFLFVWCYCANCATFEDRPIRMVRF